VPVFVHAPFRWSLQADERGLRRAPCSAYARGMQRLLLFLVVCLALPVAVGAQIYSWTDAQGNTVFSDQKPPSGVASHSVELKPLNTVPAAPAPNSAAQAAPQSAPSVTKQVEPQLRIVSPKNEQALRANNGDITIKLQLSPELAKGQALQLYLDGKVVYVGRSLDVRQQNLDRGVHHAYAVLTDAQGQVLRRSKAITFYVLRHSILFKKPAGSTP
jgi:hypothetical protein